MRWIRWLSGLVAILVIFGPLGLYVAGVRPQPFENKPLAQAPRPGDGWAALRDLPAFASDHLPGREQAVRSAAWIDYFLLGTLPDRAAEGPALAKLPGPDGPLRASPGVVRGRDGYLFLGDEFDSDCVVGAPFQSWLTAWQELASTIESSGRRVVFTVAPNKSSLQTDTLPAAVPHGQCATTGMAEQNRILDANTHPLYLDLRRALQAEWSAGEQVYWRTDTHWSPRGSATFARLLADRLVPGFSDRITLDPAPVTRLGDLVRLAGLDFTETAPGARVVTGATPRWTSDTDYGADGDVLNVHRWRSSPTGRSIPGRTVLIGDSFTYYALANLRQLFAQGEFFWVGFDDPQAVVHAVARADTVVIEVVQRFVGPYGGPDLGGLQSALADTGLPPRTP